MSSHPATAAAHAGEDAFYRELPAFTDFRRVSDPTVYRPVPSDWFVLITDVRGSTKAIREGRYKDVNALGAGTIVAALNAAAGYDLPYVFGGDGATLLVPPAALRAVERAASVAMRAATDSFDLELRAGVVPVAELEAAGHAVRVARFRLSPTISLAMFEGGGLAEADRWIKGADAARFALAPADALDPSLFGGFECRWQPIETRQGIILTLLVVALEPDAEAARVIYGRVVDAIEARVGDLGQKRPVDTSTLRLAVDPAAFNTETRLRTGALDGLRFWFYRARARFVVGVGRWLVRSKRNFGGFDGKNYPDEVVVNSDFRKFDDTLRMVLDVSAEQADAIEGILSRAREAGEIAYGVHRSSSALMTCLVRDYRGQHIHFIDGGDGGYALAAVGLKAQLSAHKAALSAPPVASSGDPLA